MKHSFEIYLAIALLSRPVAYIIASLYSPTSSPMPLPEEHPRNDQNARYGQRRAQGAHPPYGNPTPQYFVPCAASHGLNACINFATQLY